MKKFITLACIVSFIIVVSAISAIALPKMKLKKEKQPYKKGEILVKFKKNVSFKMKVNTIKGFNNYKKSEFGSNNVMKVKLAKNETVTDALKKYQNNPNIEYAQPNFIYRAFATTPNDTLYGTQWAVHNTGQTISSPTYATNNPGSSGMDLNLEDAWDITQGSSSVVVAVLDSGVNYNHGDLASNMWDDGSGNKGYDFVDNDNDPMDYNGHGTHVAGIIGAVGNNSSGVAGVCWNVKIMAVRVLNTLGVGTTEDIVSGINYAVTNGAKVINMSLGGEDAFDQSFSDAIENAKNNGVLVVVASGNGGTDGVSDDVDGPGEDSDSSTKIYPCAFTHDNLICVAALDQSYDLATFSNYGSTSVDVAAPGVNINSLWHGTTTEVTDDFNNSGALDWNTNASGLRFAYLNVSSNDYLVFPENFDGTLKSFSSSELGNAQKVLTINGSADVITMSMYVDTTVFEYDDFSIYYSPDASFGLYDITNSSNLISSIENYTTNGYLVPFEFDITGKATGDNDANVGFEFWKSSFSSNMYGVAIYDFKINTTVLDATSIKLTDGTSMASPYVAGLAALVLSYNSEYTVEDLKNSVTNGGDDVSVLSDKTTTGKAIDAYGSLTYLTTPSGLQAQEL